MVPAKRFNEVTVKNGVGLTYASMGMSSHLDGPAAESNLTGTGEIRLIPDLSTKWQIPWYYYSKSTLNKFYHAAYS